MNARIALSIVLFFVTPAVAQEQVDQPDKVGKGAGAIGRMTIRVRVTRCEPEAKQVLVSWRRGGEGLGGNVIRGEFTSDKAAQDGDNSLVVGAWSAWLPLETVVGHTKRWEFPSLTVAYPSEGKKNVPPPKSMTMEVQFADDGKVFCEVTEDAPKGATVGFAFPGGLLDASGAKNKKFTEALNGLSTHARLRRERLEREFDKPFTPPKKFGVIGHLAGYGEATNDNKTRASGYGVRHCNPAIVAEECRALELLGMNGVVGEGSLKLADAAGVGDRFRRVYWGGPGSGSPMAAVSSRGAGEPDGCPFDARLPGIMAKSIESAIAEHEATRSQDRWALWCDEIGVAVKSHMNECEQCHAAFRQYLRSQKVTPDQLGAKDWSEVKPYPLWKAIEVNGKPSQTSGPPPKTAQESLRYYYTHRFMTHATAQLFPASAKTLDKRGIKLYAMQGPTPSWSGHSLDWHEFYDHDTNTALVWETSNRDPRTWQLESYLADIMRGIGERHRLPIGCLIKPHRGAPQQRMLSVISRGTQTIEWYTYGPDYAKGDSFSQSPELLVEVAKAGRFLAEAEPYLYGAKLAKQPQVAFVSPRSSEVWGKAGELGITAFEDAKWVYLALRHAQVPVDILSEQQLAEGALEKYKVCYVVGPNLHRSAHQPLQKWVEDGGVLWIDALGLSRDEANQPANELNAALKLGERKYEHWGTVPAYKATRLEPIGEKDRPADAAVLLKWEGKEHSVALSAGREVLIAPGAHAPPPMLEHQVGQGRVFQLSFWAGLTYSAKVRSAEYDMTTDFDPALADLIARAGTSIGVERPVVANQPIVECVLLKKNGKHSVAIINWAYRQPQAGAEELIEHRDVRIDLPGTPRDAKWRSLVHGKLAVVAEEAPFVVLPKLGAIDLLVEE